MLKSPKFKRALFVVAVLLIAVPSFVLSSHKTKLYVDEHASGTQDGSGSHPYKTIAQAVRAASKNTEIHIAKGTYEENVDLKEGMGIFGEDKSDVIIKAGDKGDAVVTMADNTTLDKVTVENGRYGVKVEDGAKASIIQCIVKNNHRDGIFVVGDGIKKSSMVSISENEIRDNDGTGLYAQKRKLSITDNEIRNNNGDGIDIESGSAAWIADNKISSNDKSGMKLRVDGSEIWTKSNSIRNNDREGIEISYKGKAGRIDIAKTKIMGNKKYGVARVQKFLGNTPVAAWNKYVTFNTKNTITGNKDGDISSVIISN